MPRVKCGVTVRVRRRKVFTLAKDYRGRRKDAHRVAKQATMRVGQYAYRDRRQRKCQFRQSWVARINADARENDLSYSRFMNGLKRVAIETDCKVLADLAVSGRAAFAKLVEKARVALTAQFDKII